MFFPIRQRLLGIPTEPLTRMNVLRVHEEYIYNVYTFVNEEIMEIQVESFRSSITLALQISSTRYSLEYAGEQFSQIFALTSELRPSLKAEPANLICDRLQSVKLPSLLRPPVGPFDNPTESLVLWGLTDYAYSTIAHMRTILSGLMDLAASGNQPTILIVCRHVFEWTMHSCYVGQVIGEHIKNSDWKKAWEFFLEVDTGNSWIKKHGLKYWSFPDADDVPNSVRIAKLVKAYEKHQSETSGSQDVRDSYGYLSEHAHANGACFLSYRRLNGAEVSFVEAPKKHSFPGVLHASATEWIMFTYSLLGLSKENLVRMQILSIIKDLARMALEEDARKPSAQ